MRLSQDTIYYWLVKTLSVQYQKKNETKIGFKRPVFYKTGMDISETVVIIDNNDLTSLLESSSHNAANTLFLCTEKPNRTLKTIEGTVMVVESDISVSLLFNYLQDIYNRFDQWDERLNQIYYENGSFQDLIDSCEPILPEQVLLVDQKFHYTAYSKSVDEMIYSHIMDDNQNPSSEEMNDFLSDSSFQALYDLPDIFDYTKELSSGTDEMICKNVLDHGKYVGRFVIHVANNKEFNKNYIRAILSHLSQTADKLFAKYQSFDIKELVLNSLREPLMQILQGNHNLAEHWEHAAYENGWNNNDRLQLIQFRSNTRYSQSVYSEYLSSEIEKQWQGCVCLNYKENLLMLINLDQFESANDTSFHRLLPYFLRDNLLLAGLSRVFTDVYELRAAYEQTEIALNFGIREHPTFWYYQFNNYALSYLLKTCLGRFKIQQVCSEKLLALRQYDTKNHTEYYQTLLTFFTCRFNATTAAKKLYIHRSSFHSRLERISELFKIDLDSNDELLYLGLSLMILEWN